jgi:CheY-like chemotaxis protein
MSPDGYDLCQRFKGNGATGGISVLILGSQHTPIDADKAKSAGADDTALKPYDTNTFIEKVKGLIAKGGARAPAAQVATYRQAPAAVAAPAAAAAPAAVAAPKKPTLELADDDEPILTVGGASPAPVTAPAPPAPVPGVIGRPAAPAPPAPAPALAAAKPPQRATIGFGASPLAAAKPAASAPAPAPTPIVTAKPAVAAPVASAATAAAASVAPKLEGMGLTPDQVTAILSLTKEVIERVVWEVVPDLAETIIREEIQRLTK